MEEKKLNKFSALREKYGDPLAWIGVALMAAIMVCAALILAIVFFFGLNILRHQIILLFSL